MKFTLLTHLSKTRTRLLITVRLPEEIGLCHLSLLHACSVLPNFKDWGMCRQIAVHSYSVNISVYVINEGMVKKSARERVREREREREEERGRERGRKRTPLTPGVSPPPLHHHIFYCRSLNTSFVITLVISLLPVCFCLFWAALPLSCLDSALTSLTIAILLHPPPHTWNN